MDNGEKYVLFYMKLLLESIAHDGELRFSDIIPYDEKTLSIITNTDVDVVRSAMKLLTELGMVQILDDSTIFMSECQKMIGNDNTAERVRKSREKKRLLEEKGEAKCNVTVTLPSISISNSNSKSISNKFIPPTIEEVKAYCIERNNCVDAETFVDFYESKGWFVGKNKMKDWKSAVRTWEKRDSGKEQKPINWFEVE